MLLKTACCHIVVAVYPHHSSVIDLIDKIDMYILGRLWLWYKSAEFRTSEIEPRRPLPSISLSNLDVRKRFELHFRFSIDLYGKSRTKPRMASEIRRVTEAWNTPARLYPSLLFDMCTRRRRIPSVSKRIHAIPTMKGPRLPVFRFNLELYGGFGPRMR